MSAPITDRHFVWVLFYAGALAGGKSNAAASSMADDGLKDFGRRFSLDIPNKVEENDPEPLDPEEYGEDEDYGG